MKGSCAVMLRLLRDLATRPERPDVGFQFVSDEEIGGAAGTGRLLSEGWRCDLMLCLEPTDLGILYAHKGCMWVELALPGRPAHGSHPWEGHNPIGDLARGLLAVEARFPPPAGPNEWRTTVTPTALQAGAGSRNQVPGSAAVTFDIRFTADDTPEDVLAALRECFPTLRQRSSRPVTRCTPTRSTPAWRGWRISSNNISGARRGSFANTTPPTRATTPAPAFPQSVSGRLARASILTRSG